MNEADRLREEGFQVGLERGERSMLMKLLHKRFGFPLPGTAIFRIELAGREQIEAWFDRGLTAPTLAEVLDEGQPSEIEKFIKNAFVTKAADKLREQGRLDGQREVFLKHLGKRFGALPEDAVVRVNAAGQAELDAWVDRLFTATTLAEVLGEG
jgi:hypothetical protein